MKWALVDPSNIVMNLIVYDGVAEFTPPSSLTLRQVEDWIRIDQDADAPKPVPPE